jgi:hypothetical protein
MHARGHAGVLDGRGAEDGCRQQGGEAGAGTDDHESRDELDERRGPSDLDQQDEPDARDHHPGGECPPDADEGGTRAESGATIVSSKALDLLKAGIESRLS